MGLLKAADNLKMWVEVPGFPGFDVEVCYLTPAHIKSLQQKATKRQINRQTRQVEDVVDTELLSKLMVRDMIGNWRGLTVEHLEKMMPLAPEARQAIAERGELPFSADDLEALVEYTYSRSFMDPMTELATDMESWREAEETLARKNSGGSVATSEPEPGHGAATTASGPVS